MVAWSGGPLTAAAKSQETDDIASGGGSPATMTPSASANPWASAASALGNSPPLASTDPKGATTTASANIDSTLLSEALDQDEPTSVNWGGASPASASTLPLSH